MKEGHKFLRRCHLISLAAKGLRRGRKIRASSAFIGRGLAHYLLGRAYLFAVPFV